MAPRVAIGALVLLVACGSPGSASVRATAGTTTTSDVAVRPTTSAPTRPSTPSLPPTSKGPGPPAGSGVDGTVRFSPVCPVERTPPDPQCAARPGSARIQLLGPDGVVVASGDAGTDGRFSIAIAPGVYAVRAVVPVGGPGRGCIADPANVIVAARSVTTVVVSCDTGIR